MPGGPQVSPQKTQSIAKNEGSCKYCCDMRNERRFAKSEVQYNPDKVTLNIEKIRFGIFFSNRKLIVEFRIALHSVRQIRINGYFLKCVSVAS